MGGSLGDALSGSGIGWETAHTIGNIIASGFIGGLSSVAQGGSFGSGFLAAGIGSLAGGLYGSNFDPGKMIASAVLGGAASILGGGKFANGAITGAFSYAATASYGEGDIRVAANDSQVCDVGRPTVTVWGFRSMEHYLTPLVPELQLISMLANRRGTLQIGYARQYTKGIPGTPFSGAGMGGVGVAIDTYFNARIYYFGGAGGGAGISASGGVSLQVSDALTIYDLKGAFANSSVSGGDVTGGSIDYFRGNGVKGVGFTVGGGEGLSYSEGATDTYICNGNGCSDKQ